MHGQLTFDDHDGLLEMKTAWSNALETIQSEVSPAVFGRFIKPLSVQSVEENHVIFSAPGAFIVEWVRERFLDRLTAAMEDELGRNVRVDVMLRAREKEAVAPKVTHAVTRMVATDRDPDVFIPNERYRFESFVEGQSNRLAVAGARAVAQDPGGKFNPLFIYGGSGLGKTHLLHAIAHEVQKRHPKLTLQYITAQQFAEDFVQALQSKRVDVFRRQQRNAHIWLVDDIQFIAGRDKTSEEVFHTFNALQQLGKQIVLCADRPPRDLYAMDERLRSRFEAGLVVDVQAPDTETKSAIILMKARQEGIEITPEIALHMASNISGNIRVLEGALNRIATLASVEQVPITIDYVESQVSQYYQTQAPSKPDINAIVEAVGRYYRIPNAEILGLSRKAPVAHARHVAVYITREITGDSWKHIGWLFGDRDHTSMMHAHHKISALVQRDKDLSTAVSMLIKDLWPR